MLKFISLLMEDPSDHGCCTHGKYSPECRMCLVTEVTCHAQHTWW